MLDPGENVSFNFSGSKGSEKVLAVIVTYQPGNDLEINIRALISQSDCVLIVDNGSANVTEIARAATVTGCRLICNSTNLGISTAFNQGIALALNEGFQWVATFDQDSLASPGLLADLLSLYHNHPRRNEIGVIAPTHRDRGTGYSYSPLMSKLDEDNGWRIVRSCISSGSLVPTSVYARVGMLDEKLFIDFVDHDFCLRCRAQGMIIVESTRSVLSHSIGESTVRQFLGRRIVFTNHVPGRYYYMTRNQLEVYRRNLHVDFFWAARGLFFQAVTGMLVLIFEENRGLKFRAMLHGVRDFFLRRFGPRREQ